MEATKVGSTDSLRSHDLGFVLRDIYRRANNDGIGMVVWCNCMK